MVRGASDVVPNVTGQGTVDSGEVRGHAASTTLDATCQADEMSAASLCSRDDKDMQMSTLTYGEVPFLPLAATFSKVGGHVCCQGPCVPLWVTKGPQPHARCPDQAQVRRAAGVRWEVLRHRERHWQIRAYRHKQRWRWGGGRSCLH